MRPVTLQRASHTEAGIGRSSPPPSPPEVSSDTGGRRVEIGEQGTLTKLGQDPTRLGTMGELSLIFANNLPQEDGHLCQHHFKIIFYVHFANSTRKGIKHCQRHNGAED